MPMHSLEEKVKELNKQIQEDDAGGKRDALAALAAIASFKPDDDRALDALRQSANTCLELAETSDDEKVVQNCALVLSSMFRLGTFQPDGGTSHRYAETLVRALREERNGGETKAAIVEAVIDFSQIGNSNRQLLLDAGIVSFVVNATKGIDDPRILFTFGNALINLSMDRNEYTDELVKAGGLRVYLALIKSQEPSARQVGLLGVGMAIGKNVCYALEFINMPGAIGEVTACMQSQNTDEKSIASDIFFTLGDTPECKDALLAALQGKVGHTSDNF